MGNREDTAGNDSASGDRADQIAGAVQANASSDATNSVVITNKIVVTNE